MKIKIIKTFYVTSAFLCVALICVILFLKANKIEIADSIPGSCTIFTASYGQRTLFGNNEDYTNPETYYWVEPRSDGNYGGVYFGIDFGFVNFIPQGGINERGLAYDANALPNSRLNLHS